VTDGDAVWAVKAFAQQKAAPSAKIARVFMIQ